MKSANIRELKKELAHLTAEELQQLCLRLARFKKENKELLTYLLYESYDEEAYIRGVQEEMDEQFDAIKAYSYYYINKSVRKILRNVRKHIRFSGKKETQVELMIHFCQGMEQISPSIKNSRKLWHLQLRLLDSVRKTINGLHEDLQYDYLRELEDLGK